MNKAMKAQAPLIPFAAAVCRNIGSAVKLVANFSESFNDILFVYNDLMEA